MTRFRPGFLSGVGTFEGVNFGGTQYLEHTGTLGLANGKKAMGSFWFRATRNGTAESIVFAFGGYFQIIKNGSDKINILGYDTGLTLRVNISSTSTVNVARGWVHVLFAFDTDAGWAYVYIDDVDDTTITTLTSGATIDFTPTAWAVGGVSVAKYQFDVGQIWVAPGSALDLTTEANRRYFVTAGVRPKLLGADGSAPGITPAMYFDGDASSFGTNRGSGGAFTQTGTFTTVEFP